MKQRVLLILFVSVLASCGNDDDITPTPVNEQELITTLKLTFTPAAGGNDVVFSYKDIDGAGPENPVIVEGVLTANTMYNVSTELLNETKDASDPEYNITAEVKEEGEEHQVFYTVSGSPNLTFAYLDQDNNQKPIGLSVQAGCGDASTGKLAVTLRHLPDKNGVGVEAGDITNAGGETDVEVTFNISIE